MNTTNNHIISACCSVDDLRCHLRLLKTDSPEEAKKAYDNIQAAIDFEKTKWNRSTIIKMLDSKLKNLDKIINQNPPQKPTCLPDYSFEIGV